MNKQDLQYCCNCMESVIKYDGNKYYCYCRKKKKEVGFYHKCEEHK